MDILEQYRENKIRLNILYAQIAALTEYLKEADDEFISGETFRHELDKPNVQNNRITDATPDIALKLDKYKDKREIIFELQAKKYEAAQLQCEVAPVTAALNALKDRDRWIIEQYYFRGANWETISDAYYNKYGIPMSKRQIIRIRNRAIQKLGEILA